MPCGDRLNHSGGALLVYRTPIHHFLLTPPPNLMYSIPVLMRKREREKKKTPYIVMSYTSTNRGKNMRKYGERLNKNRDGRGL